MSELAAFITALATLIAAGTALASAVLNSRRIKSVDKKVVVVEHKVDDVHDEIKTGNSQTLAQLADAIETRRIGNILPKDRTSLEKSHVLEVDNKVQSQGLS